MRNSNACVCASDGFVDCNKDRTVPKDRAFPDGLPRYAGGNERGAIMLLGEGREGKGKERRDSLAPGDRQHI